MRLRFAPSSSLRPNRAAHAAALALALVCAISASGYACADENDNQPTEPAASAPHAASAAGPPSADAHAASAPESAAFVPVPRETSIVTKHALRLDGHRLEYRATAGNLLLRDKKGEPIASMFYVAYTAGGTQDHPGVRGAARPVTFLFNGGPGAASIFLMMGSIGPKRVRTASPSATPPAPYVLADNPDSMLDKTDLVFADAVGTGFSKVVGHGNSKQFWGVDSDLNAFTQFIERYLTANYRWNSPKFLV